MQEQPRRRALGRVGAVRERIRSHRGGRVVYRFVVGLLGGAITLGGLLLVPLPGPGWLVVFAGLALLATEFEAARRLLEFARHRLQAWTGWLARRGPAVRGAVVLAALACVLAAVYAVLVVAGVPSWVPDGAVPPLPGLALAPGDGVDWAGRPAVR